MAYIEIENLKYRYPKTKNLALDGITLSIEKGSFVGIIGRNGSDLFRSSIREHMEEVLRLITSMPQKFLWQNLQRR